MNRPPLAMGLRIGGDNLWLPVFLLAPLIWAFMLLLLPFLLLGALLLWPFGWGKPLLLFIPLTLDTLHALRGLDVKVIGVNKNVFIAFR